MFVFISHFLYEWVLGSQFQTHSCVTYLVTYIITFYSDMQRQLQSIWLLPKKISMLTEIMSTSQWSGKAPNGACEVVSVMDKGDCCTLNIQNSTQTISSAAIQFVYLLAKANCSWSLISSQICSGMGLSPPTYVLVTLFRRFFDGECACVFGGREQLSAASWPSMTILRSLQRNVI